MSRIAVFGAGYVGLVTGACFADLGHDVILRDVLPERIEQLRRGEVPIYEPGLDEVIERNRDRLAFTLDVREAVSGAEYLYVAVGTPPTYSGDADLSAVWTVVDELPAETRAIVVMKSTVPVGTGEKVRSALDARGLAHVGYVSNPEFLAEGTALRDFRNPDRIVVGAFDPADGDGVAGLHAALDAPVVRTDVASAEMIKMASNAFLSTRISFINEIANVCELVGADVEAVAEGMGLDHRLGRHFLRAGIGFGGSCLVGDETVLVRRQGRTRLVALEELFEELAPDEDATLARPEGLDVLAWREGAEAPEFFPVAAATRRSFDGELVELRTKMGRRLRSTPDHPFVVGDGSLKRADELTEHDWLPVALGAPEPAEAVTSGVLLGAEIAEEQVIVRPFPGILAEVGVQTLHERIAHPGGRARAHDIVRANAMRLSELRVDGIPFAGSMLGTARNGTYVPESLELDERFWHVAGLYAAKGHCTTDGRRRRLSWSFHPRDEFDLVEAVARFWRVNGVKATIDFAQKATRVTVSSRLLASWWIDQLGLGTNCYEQRVSDLLWDAPESHKRAFLAGVWRGDGSWSLVRGGPSVVLEYGTVSRELADGVLRLLGELGIMARLKVGRTALSTCDTYWLVVAGADQVERVLDLVSAADRPRIRESIARQAKRIAPTGYRRDGNAAWVRVVETARRPFRGFVYSLEVPGAHTFVATGGLVTHNCFPKDISALKKIAGNSGYHFQLLAAVIEVNELQKRRVIQKLEKHLGSLRGMKVALLGLAFKPGTDDMREAPSLVLAARLQAEGAEVTGWDPVAEPGELLPHVRLCETYEEAVAGADAAVIVTEWPQLRELPREEVRESMRRPLIVDGRNLLDPAEVRALGFAYEGIGRPTSPLDVLPETRERQPELDEA
jgi:UDPglucose 6-dehydrogenase